MNYLPFVPVLRALCLLIVTLPLHACTAFTPEPPWKAAVAGDGPGNPVLLTPESVKVQNLPRSRSGNSSTYEVFGIRYAVLDTAKGFREQGTASWYGTKFHGNATSSGEIYDMYQLTAAHKHLPLPTFVRVTRVDTGQSLIVKVNDRGPFVGDRVIDLSYAAAASLDMLEHGKAEVLIEAISHDEELAKGASPAGSFIQLGAFSNVDNAEALKRRVGDNTQLPVGMDFEAARQLYRVVVGPLKNEESVSDALQRLASNGFSGFSLQPSSVQ